MIGSLRNLWDNFRGSGAWALTVPPMDGAFRPNTAIETAQVVTKGDQPDNVVVAGGSAFYSDGARVIRLAADRTPETIAAMPGAVTAIAGAPDGTLAIATISGGISFVGPRQPALRALRIEAGQGDITAMAFVDAERLAITVGSQVTPGSKWREDLMQLRRAGSAWIGNVVSGAAEKIADGLGYPAGVVGGGSEELVVAEAWLNRLVGVDKRGGRRVLLDNLPAYPGRLSSASRGGYWLTLFAPRNQLVEFVLREPAYRKRMMREIQPDYWVSPSLTPHESPLSPMQEGGQKIGGAIKPWAPSLSYGLVARLDRNCQPQYSLHSRADGRRHGVTSAVEFGERLLATSRGAGLLVEVAFQ